MIKLGQLLYKYRAKKKLSLEDAAKATKIKASFLSAIEKGDYNKLPSPAYAKGFAVNYATFLGIPKAEAIALFRREFDEKRAYKVLPDSLTETTKLPTFRIKIQESLLIVVGLIIVFLVFLFFQYKSFFFAPTLAISSPKEGAILQREIVVTGKTNTDATVTVNNEAVSLNDKGEFTKKLELFSGKTEVTIVSRSRFGKETVITRNVVVK